MNESEYIESRQPDYMRPVTETPLTDAAFAEYPVLDTQRGGDAITIQAARKIETSLRAQLAETQEKLKEAERREIPDPQSAIKESKLELMTKLLTAQLCITELRAAAQPERRMNDE